MAVFAHRSTDKAGNKAGNNACGKTCVTNNASCKRSGIILTAKKSISAKSISAKTIPAKTIPAKSISAKSILAIMLSICAFFSAAMSNLALSNPVPSNAVPLQTAPEAKDSAGNPRSVDIIAFEQSWNTIADECEKTYGPEGIRYVETSPAQETIKGTQWWTSYQPVSYKLDSKLGSEDEFKSMVSRCKAVGVGIIVDVVFNQTTGQDGSSGRQTGVAGTEYDAKNGDYPGFPFTKADYHDCDSDISNYKDAYNVRNCRLSSMWDLNTGSEHVRDVQSDYLAKLDSYGVEGYRIDAAKHIDPSDLSALKEAAAKKTGKNADDILWIQEVIDNDGEAEQLAPSYYYQTGQVTEFRYGYTLKTAFKGRISGLKNIDSKMLIPSDKANAFVANWDTVRNGSTLKPQDGSAYDLANTFMLAWNYGSVRLLSDYYFKDGDKDNGPASAGDTRVKDVDFDKACSAKASSTGDWNCQQRSQAVRSMIAFHNYASGAKVTNWQEGTDNTIAFGREDKGFVVINNSSASYKGTFSVSVKDGEYCDVYNKSDCSATLKVKDGKLQADVPAQSAVLLSADSMKDNSSENKSSDSSASQTDSSAASNESGEGGANGENKSNKGILIGSVAAVAVIAAAGGEYYFRKRKTKDWN